MEQVNEELTKRQVEDLFIKTIRVGFEKRGYKYFKSKHSFESPHIDGYKFIGIGFYNYFPIYELSLIFGVRINIVENIYHTAFPEKISDGEKKNTITFTTSYGRLHNIPNYSYERIRSKEDIETIALKVTDFFNKEGFKYLDDYSDIKKMNEAMNSNPSMRSIHISDMYGQLNYKAVIVAKLANNPRYNELVEFYRQEFYPLRDAEQLREKYDQLVDHLKTVRPIV